MKVAVIGVGHLGKEHARVYHQIPNIELVAVVDKNENQAKLIANNWNVQALYDYHELLGKVDAVSVATPTITHFSIAKDFLESGVHVLLEKPMTKTVEEAEELVKIAREKKVKFQIGHIERFNPAVMEIARRKIQPVYLEASRLSPFRFRSGDVSVILDVMIHDIDIVRMLVPSPVERVEAVGINVLGKRVDIANARISFECGCVANITASRAASKPSRQLRIFASDCYVAIDYATKECKILKKPKQSVLENLNLQHSVPEQFQGLSFEDIFYGKLLTPEPITIQNQEQLYAELESFIHSIQNDTKPVVSGEDGLETMKIADMIGKDIDKNLERLQRRFEGQDI